MDNTTQISGLAFPYTTSTIIITLAQKEGTDFLICHIHNPAEVL